MPEDEQRALIVDEPFRWSDPERPGRERTGRIRGVLAATGRGTVGLAVKRTFIGDAGRDLLPPWAGFLEGVLTCDELTSNAARDGVRENAALLAARRALAEFVARELLADDAGFWLFEPLDAREAGRYAALERACAKVFGEWSVRVRARVGRFEPATLPVVLIDPSTLHLNAAHPIVRRLAARPDPADEVGRAALESLYDNALIQRDAAPDADAAQSMFVRFNHVIGLMLESAEDRPASPPQPAYLSCAVTLPEGEPRSEEIFAAVRSVLEDRPHYWRVRRADSVPQGSDLPPDLDQPPAGAALNVAVFAGPRLNQGLLDEISIGQILGLPQLILIDEGHPELPSSFADVPRCTVHGGSAALREEVLTALAGIGVASAGVTEAANSEVPRPDEEEA